MTYGDACMTVIYSESRGYPAHIERVNGDYAVIVEGPCSYDRLSDADAIYAHWLHGSPLVTLTPKVDFAIYPPTED